MQPKDAVATPAQRALWFVESHLCQEIALEDVASAAGVSRYHLARAFAAGTGLSLMRYVRARRLTEAARALAAGAPGILDVAVAWGYGSHEAFTRAFRDHFGATPESVRDRSGLHDLELMEPIRMDATTSAKLEPPRRETGRALLVAGIGERYNQEASARIPSQWERFIPHLGHVRNQVGNVAYGVICNSDDSGNADYIAGVEVSDFSGIPADWARIRIPEQRYAVFAHNDHVSAIRRTWMAIFNSWMPESGCRPTGGPEFERYGEDFNPATGRGGIEIWIPVKA